MPFLNPNRRHGIPLRRRKKLPRVRLGGKRPRRVAVLIEKLRKIRLRWLKIHYKSILKKLKETYKNMIKDLAEAGGSLDTYQRRVFLESSFALPIMGVSTSSFSTCVSPLGSNRSRTLVM
ncbi:hypothetical protein F8388_021528 [Cannabis sativa]|uniref:Uncharacterized protein n=3 Tax=Cannabis sativa TaxID=3483 RepID=A0A7J6HVL7_CANSA|nr:hypothetical protein F8388_021528 [Cannabis sativa]KAF4379438.1 hypothetical protein G4B88_024886 [Cannabis sativa]KAF4399364.1 hypothetical protein G4B88_022447 [Cannabis sativa]